MAGDADGVTSDAALRQMLHGLPGVDQVGAQGRVAGLATRSIKKDAKLAALDARRRDGGSHDSRRAPTRRARCADCAPRRSGLTQPIQLCRPSPPFASTPTSSRVAKAALAESGLAGSRVAVASVATAFPSGRASLAVKLADVADAVAAGADEIDMVIDRGAFLAGRYGQVYEEIRAVKEACGAAHLKVILETGELATLDNVSRASWLAMLAGADFIKTSTGKVSPASTLPVALVMLDRRA